jgi:hypothetical protein
MGAVVNKPLVYLAAPYSSDPVGNTRQAIESGMDLWQSGLVAVVIPHLSLLSDLVRPMPSADWYRFDLDIVEHCDAVLRLGGDSTGADVEVDCAHQHGIPVFTERADLFAWASRWVSAGEATDG